MLEFLPYRSPSTPPPVPLNQGIALNQEYYVYHKLFKARVVDVFNGIVKYKILLLPLLKKDYYLSVELFKETYLT